MRIFTCDACAITMPESDRDDPKKHEPGCHYIHVLYSHPVGEARRDPMMTEEARRGLRMLAEGPGRSYLSEIRGVPGAAKYKAEVEAALDWIRRLP